MSTVSAPAFASHGANGSFGASLRDDTEDVELEDIGQKTVDHRGIDSLDLEASGTDAADRESKIERSPNGHFDHPSLITSSNDVEVIERGYK